MKGESFEEVLRRHEATAGTTAEEGPEIPETALGQFFADAKTLEGVAEKLRDLHDSPLLIEAVGEGNEEEALREARTAILDSLDHSPYPMHHPPDHEQAWRSEGLFPSFLRDAVGDLRLRQLVFEACDTRPEATEKALAGCESIADVKTALFLRKGVMDSDGLLHPREEIVNTIDALEKGETGGTLEDLPTEGGLRSIVGRLLKQGESE